MSFSPTSPIAIGQQFSATDLTLLISACAGAVVSVIAGFRLSKCRRVNLCRCIEFERDLPKETPTAPPNTPNDASSETAITEDASSLV